MLSPRSFTRNALTALLFGLRNAAGIIDHLVAQHMHPSSADNEFVGMTDYISESFYNLLAEDYEAISNSGSSRGSHHPSRECFMADTPDGHVEIIHEREDTPAWPRWRGRG